MPAKATVRAAMEMDTSGFDRAVDGAKVKVADFDNRIKTASGNVRNMATLTTGVSQILSGNFSGGIKSITVALTHMNSALAASLTKIASVGAAFGAGFGIGTAIDRVFDISGKIGNMFGAGPGDQHDAGAQASRAARLEQEKAAALAAETARIVAAAKGELAAKELRLAEEVAEIEKAKSRETSAAMLAEYDARLVALNDAYDQEVRKFAQTRGDISILEKRLQDETAQIEKAKAKETDAAVIAGYDQRIELLKARYEQDVQNFAAAEEKKVAAVRAKEADIQSRIAAATETTPEQTIDRLKSERARIISEETAAKAAPESADAVAREQARIESLQRQLQLAQNAKAEQDARQSIIDAQKAEAEKRKEEQFQLSAPLPQSAMAAIGGFFTTGRAGGGPDDTGSKIESLEHRVNELIAQQTEANEIARQQLAELAGG